MNRRLFRNLGWDAFLRNKSKLNQSHQNYAISGFHGLEGCCNICVTQTAMAWKVLQEVCDARLMKKTNEQTLCGVIIYQLNYKEFRGLFERHATLAMLNVKAEQLGHRDESTLAQKSWIGRIFKEIKVN